VSAQEPCVLDDRIQTDLHFSQSSLTWVVNAYLITFGSFLLVAGRLGDLIGRRRVLLIGLAVFTAASALCGLAQAAPCSLPPASCRASAAPCRRR
jgi:MFS family permease